MIDLDRTITENNPKTLTSGFINLFDTTIRLARLHRKSSLSTIVVMTLLAALFCYAPLVATLLSPTLEDYILPVFIPFYRFLFLISVLFAAWLYGTKAGLLICLMVGPIIIARVLLNFDLTIAGLEFLVICLGLFFSGLAGRQREMTLMLEKRTSELQNQSVKLSIEIIGRKRSEAALLAERENFRNSFEMSPFGVQIISPKGNIAYVNHTMLNMWGYSSLEQLTSVPIKQTFTPESLALIRGMHKLRNSDKVPPTHELTMICRNSKKRIVRVYSKDIVWNGERCIQMIHEDITERKQMENELRRSEEKFAKVFRNSPDPIMLVSITDGRIVEVNGSFLRMTGYISDEVIGRTTLELNLWCDPADRNRYFEQNRTYGRASSSELDMRMKSGEVRNCSVLGEVLEISEGKLILGIIRDVTEQKKMQENLMATDRLASIGELASGMAHELNNPLTAVIGFSELLMEESLPDNIKEDVEMMCREAKRTADVVRNMLTFARRHPATKQPADINNIIEKTLEMRAYDHRLNNISVYQHFEEGLPEILVDFFQMQQVFLNIIINAEYFMKEAHGKGTLTITTQQTEGNIKITIMDDGLGISKENLNRIFNPFYTTKPVGKGTGLGLSICHGIVTGHGGKIYAESESGKGASFIVELPIST
jgi:two-component system, NtrC family, sensor kinase